MRLQLDQVPEELKGGVRHVCWRREGGTKRPKIAGALRNASSADSQTWRTFRECLRAMAIPEPLRRGGTRDSRYGPVRRGGPRRRARPQNGGTHPQGNKDRAATRLLCRSITVLKGRE